MSHSPDPVLPLTDAEKDLVAKLNKKSKEEIVVELRTLLEAAITVELATIPIYLFTYYSINRKPLTTIPSTVPEERALQLRVYANQAGATIMSVAVEEMLHMSLSSNLLYAFGGVPELYLKSPGPPNGTPPLHYPVNLPDHAKLGPDAKPMLIPLAPLSYRQLWQFLEIEWPETPGAKPEGEGFKTIGQVYSYIRCLMLTDGLKDYKFAPPDNQLQPGYYSPNNIDTIYAKGSFNRSAPAPNPHAAHCCPGGASDPHGDPGSYQYPSGAAAAKFEDAGDGHAGHTELLAIDSLEKAQQAVATICDQGEGFNPKRIDGTDDRSGHEDSHFFKFLDLQATLQKPADFHEPQKGPPPTPPGIPLITDDELKYFVFPFPENPVTRNDGFAGGGMRYTDPVHQAISDALNGLYQYMLILTETSFKVSGIQQKKLFYQGMHMSMIWIMDKLIQQMRLVPLNDGLGSVLAPTFENISLGDRSVSYKNLVALANTAITAVAGNPALSDLSGYLQMFATLPDVSQHWLPQIPTFTDKIVPSNPPHACLGLNTCKSNDRFGSNDCAGQGFCSTAVSHTCHVKNDCKDQGGCGLYGTGEEQNNPGRNECKGLGSCAVPINAERFSTCGPNRGKSVWALARRRFEEQWPEIRKDNPGAPEHLHPAPAPFTCTGPTYAWISAGQCMTACGASGLSGAGSCS